MAKPTSKPDWTDGDAAKVQEPSAAKKLLGWVSLERPPFEFMNFLFFNIDEWIDYFEVTTDGLLALQSTYDAVVGVGGTHSTLNDAIADGGLGNDVRVLVTDVTTVVATQVLSKDGWEIVFKPRASFSQGAATTPAIQITANRVNIMGGRFIDFDGGSDVALQVDGDNCMIRDTRFLNCDVEIEDNGTNTSISGTLTEV